MKDIIRASARLALLRYLHDDPDYCQNISVLGDLLTAIGFDMSRAELETMATWLSERDLVVLDKTGPVAMVRLTERGAGVVAGRVVVEGVKRPSPTDIMKAAANAGRNILES
ncbi:MAG: ArsR family transcriptional regulator [Magnetospirillum sp.]|nr:ArsR family transcriptional regulator [Magnetospirillum sp.]